MTTTTDPTTSHVCISCTLYASNDYFSPSCTAGGKGENEKYIWNGLRISFVALLLLASLTQRRFNRKLDRM